MNKDISIYIYIRIFLYIVIWHCYSLLLRNQIGDIIKDKILPCAVLWFTGDASMGEEDDESFEEGEEERDFGADHEDDDDVGQECVRVCMRVCVCLSADFG